MSEPITTPEPAQEQTTKAVPPSNPVDSILEKIDAVSKQYEQLSSSVEELKTSNSNRAQGPFVSTGERASSSRGFSFVRALGAMAGVIPADECKVELDLCTRLKKNFNDNGYKGSSIRSEMLPLGSEFLANGLKDEGIAREASELMKAGAGHMDPDELRWLARQTKNAGFRRKALSAVDEATGASLIAPPQHGELIDLLRNNEIFMQAGARTVAMPPNGRVVYPRQTGAGTAYWVGSSETITGSEQSTGDLILDAKKLAILVDIPNELFRFASVSIEMFVREDMTKVLALRMDKTFLDSVGNTNEPKGLINYTNIGSHTPGTTDTNGDTFTPEDVAEMISEVEEKNAEFKAWVMRPSQYAKISNLRAGTAAVGDGGGRFMFDTGRELGAEWGDFSRMKVGSLNGYPVFKSTQVSNTRIKGSGTNLTYILGGDFNDFMIAMSGAMEFAVSTEGDTPFTKDQTRFRGILHCDGAPRHEASFTLCDQLLP